MYKLVCVLLLTAFSMRGLSQVTLNLQVPPTGIMQKSQLWNMIVVNTGSDITARIELKLTKAGEDNQPVLTATSGPIIIPKGAKQLKYSDLQPIQYEYLSPVCNVDLTPTGFLPIGNYVACYTLTALKTFATDCIPVEVQPLSPPLLNTPLDNDTLDTRYPQFTWIPPAPLMLFNNLTYDFILTKLLPGQSPALAVQQNMPEYNQSLLKNNFLNYPASSKPLDTTITYAWAIVARNNGQFVAQSDAWTFCLAKKKVLPAIDGSMYTSLKRELDGTIIPCKDVLRVEYINDAKDSIVKYQIMDINKNTTVFEGNIPLSPGKNLIQLSIGKKLSKKNTYLIHLYNSRKEKWSVKIKSI